MSAYLRDDLHEIARQNELCNFNLIHAKPCQSQEMKGSLEPTQNSNWNQDRMEAFQKSLQVIRKTKLASNMKAVHRTNTSLKREKKSLDVGRSGIRWRTLSPAKTQSPNKSKLLEKQFNKGNVEDKQIENWLNQVLVEYCEGYRFGASPHTALEQLAVDRNSLISKGMPAQNLSRVYRSLFVYSFGFNTLLKELAGGNMNLVKSVWKVYAILLEYCAEGDFQTMIGELERDKRLKLQGLHQQIARRQQCIELNEQSIANSTAVMTKKNKQLTDENQVLQVSIEALMNDLKSAEQAYNEEVRLRLAYESRINEVHSIHTQLSLKHMLLYKKHEEIKREHEVVTGRWHQKEEELNLLKLAHSDLCAESAQIQKKCIYFSQLVEELQRRMEKERSRAKQEAGSTEQSFKELKEKEKKISQLERELKNANLVMSLYSSNQNGHMEDYKRASVQNVGLKNNIQQQLRQLNVLLQKDATAEERFSGLQANVKHYEGLLKSKDIFIEQLQQQIEEVKERQLEKKNALEERNLTIDQYKANLDANVVSLAEMRRVFAAVEAELEEQKRKHAKHASAAKEAQQVTQQLHSEIYALKQDIIGKDKFIFVMQKEFSSMKQSKQHIEQSARIARSKLKAEAAEMEARISRIEGELMVKMEESDKQADQIVRLSSKLKDSMFERNSLSSLYNQNLSMFSKESEHIKELNIRISKYVEEVEGLNDCIFSLERRNEKLQTQLAASVSSQQEIKMHNSKLSSTLRQYVHPMRVEDISSRLSREKQKSIAFAEQAQILQTRYLSLQGKYEQQAEHHKAELAGKEEQFRQQSSKWQYEREFHILKTAEQQKKIEEAEIRIEGYREAQKKSKQMGDSKYIPILKDKSAQIQALLKEIELLHDQLNQVNYSAPSEIKHSERLIQQLQAKEVQTDQIALENTSIQAHDIGVNTESFELKREKSNETEQSAEFLAKKITSVAPKQQSRRHSLRNKLFHAAAYYK